MISDRTALRQRGLIALVEVLALAVWFSASAVAPALSSEWELTAAASVWLTASVQLGFVLGAVTSAFMNLADRCPPHLLLAASALGAAICTALISTAVEGLGSAIPLRFLTGMSLAGVYPVGLKLMASWTAPAQRGRAFGLLIGALTVGSAMPHLIGSFGDLPWRTVMAAAAALSATGALIAVLFLRPGPHFERQRLRPRPRYALTMLRERGPRLANLGYFGHMWELYAFWTWLPVFLLRSQDQSSTSGSSLALISFVTIGVAGAVGCLVGGWGADHFGRPSAAFVALVVSGGCCLLSPLLYVAPLPVLTAFLLVWGAAVIADSGVFSTSLSEMADPRYVGTALTAQLAIGFLLTVVTIQFVPVLAEAVGWQYAFLLLVPGPVLGALSMWSLRNHEYNRSTQEALHE